MVIQQTIIDIMSLSKTIDNNNNNNNNGTGGEHILALAEVPDQEKYLREATQYFRGIEKPLKLGPSVNTLTDLIQALHHEFETNSVNIEMVNHILLSYKSNPKEWQKYAKWDRFKYTRNLVDAGNGKFNLMILCWGEGHGSAIHDHADSHCFMKMLQGALCETRFDMPTKDICMNSSNTITGDIGSTDNDDNNNIEEEINGEKLKENSRHTLELNGVCYINDNIALHRIENLSHTDGAVSLHLYCPPFNSCSVFQKNSGKRIECPVTFWSKFGVRQEKTPCEK